MSGQRPQFEQNEMQQTENLKQKLNTLRAFARMPPSNLAIPLNETPRRSNTLPEVPRSPSPATGASEFEKDANELILTLTNQRDSETARAARSRPPTFPMLPDSTMNLFRIIP